MQDRMRVPKPKPFEQKTELKDISDKVPSTSKVLADIDEAIELAEAIEEEEVQWTYQFGLRKPRDECVC